MDTGHKKERGFCRKCRKPLSPDEIAVTKKLINRGTTVYYCIECLAQAFDVPPESIRKKIEYYKSIGCTLFSNTSP
ncbi:MAG: hypothetical protein Q4E89_10720 [Eubacteriales bacterium]|nr:hypothetical protein [Eubacteriales bacterium]